MADQPILITERLKEVELLGHDAEIIARDIHDVIQIVISDWHDERYLPGAMVPVVLDAVDRALLQQLGYFRAQVHDNIELLAYIEAHEKKITARVLTRESKKSLEAAA